MATAPNSDVDGGGGADGYDVRDEAVVELVNEVVDVARAEAKRSLAEANQMEEDSEGLNDAVKPKLTVDLRQRQITKLPEPAVEVLQEGVERYALQESASSSDCKGGHKCCDR